MALPGALIPWIEMRWLDLNGNLLSGGKIYTYTAGTATPKATYTDSGLTTPHTNPIVLDSYGRSANPIFLASGGYKFIVFDATDVQQYSVDNVQDVGLTWLSTLGTTFATGSASVTSGYAVISSDYCITVASTGGANPCIINLPGADDRGQPIGIKNTGTIPVAVTPDGSDTIDSAAGAFTLPPASNGFQPSVWLVSDGVSNWSILASHGLAVPRQISLAAAPTTGTWAVGDIVWNATPVSAGSMGWICTVAGTPGTWVAMPALA